MPNSVRVAMRSLRGHRLRSALTMLGIVIGVASVVVMIGVGVGARERVAEQIRSLGANLITVSPGSAQLSSVRLGSGASPRLNVNDAQAIAQEVPGVVAAAPVVYGRAQFTVGSANWAGSLRGVTPDYFTAREWEVVQGREMTPEDDRRSAKVLLLGDTMRQKLFDEVDPIDMTVRIRDVPFTVIGLLKRKGQSIWGEDQDDVALMPLSTARQQFVGVNRASPLMVHNITVKFADWTTAEATMAEIDDLLRQRHRLRERKDETFLLSNVAEAADVEETTTRVVTLLLAAVASVALVVGGIGIMNIMLVTVTERTREIGLRMAIGARRRDILSQFLIEAAVLALLGGFIGAVTGVSVSTAIGALAQWPVIIDLSSIVLAIGVAAVVGIVFGYYPARRAALLQPIEALRAE